MLCGRCLSLSSTCQVRLLAPQLGWAYCIGPCAKMQVPNAVVSNVIRTLVDTESRIVYQVGEGEVSLSDILLAMVNSFDHPNFNPDFAVLWDFLNAEVKISFFEIENISPSIIELANQKREEGKTAWVPRTAYGEVTLRMLYEQYDWKSTWRTFATLEAALAWCKTR